MLAERDYLLKSLVGLSESVVSSYVWRNPRFGGYKEDLISVGSVKVIETVDRFLAKQCADLAHIRNYSRKSIMTGISDFLRSNGLIGGRRAKKIPPQELRIDPVDEKSTVEVGLIREDLEAVCTTNEDQVLVSMVLRGQSRREIAKTFCTTQKDIKQRLEDIVQRASNQ